MLLINKMKIAALAIATIHILSVPVYAINHGFAGNGGSDLRESASHDSNLLASIDSSEKLQILASSGDWFLIQTEDLDHAYAEKASITLTEIKIKAISDSVNIRSEASTSAGIISILNEGDSVVAVGKSDSWIKIDFKDQEAYVYAEYFESEFLDHLVNYETEYFTYAVVNSSDGLNLRVADSKEAHVVSILSNGQKLEVLEVNGEWIKVKTNAGMEGYISSEFVQIKTEAQNLSSPGSTKGVEIVTYAKQYIGTPYSWGGTNLNSGVDCSGFVYAVFRDFGINLNRVAADMVANGTNISKDELLPGDLVFHDTSGSNNSSINHVGIYIGNNQFVHASSGSAYSVTISNLNEGYYVNTYVTAVRISH